MGGTHSVYGLDLDVLTKLSHNSHTTYSQSTLRRNSIGCHKFDQAMTYFNKLFSWLVKLMLPISRFLRISFHGGCSPTRF